ncbi:AfsR/SARP family transcriptional regulator [Actinomadura rudentiformis]|uniref:AfsR/SARP family transcriptional regulator n=1 Tax=Actinomadura rudentiformis TaxID=359158 RepID=UPI00178C7C63|nr:AfsR/SARP family transcriptional regulator [Actinomadura rudentiformis]
MQAVDGGRQIRLPGPRPRLVLAVLLLEPGRVISVDRLVETVWDGEPPASMRTQIAIAVSALRRTFREAGLGDVIETVSPGYRIKAGARIDACIAEEHVAAARAAAADGRAEEAAVLYRKALALWRGPVLAGLDSSRIITCGLRWEELRLTVVEELAELDLARGHHHQVAGELMALVAENPFRERLRAQLMTALARSGRQAESLAVYQEGRRILKDELGLEPGRALRDLHEAILKDAPSVQQRPTPLHVSAPTAVRAGLAAPCRHRGRHRAGGLRRAAVHHSGL